MGTVDADLAEFYALVDIVRRRLPRMTSHEVFVVERDLPKLMSSAREIEGDGRLAALSVLAADVRLLREGLLVPDHVALDDDLMARLEWMLAHTAPDPGTGDMR